MANRVRASIRASAALLIGFGTFGIASGAAAACGDGVPRVSSSWDGHNAADLLRLASEDSPGNHSIVGMWSFKMAAGGGFSDFGYQQWHSDGTEFMNSGGRAPATQNYCLGVWRQVAPSRYHLNHFALSYDNSGVLNGRINIKEDVTLDRSGTSYSGAFTIDIYDPSGATAVGHVAGQVTAQRVPAN